MAYAHPPRTGILIYRLPEHRGFAMHGLHLIDELYDCRCDPQLLADAATLRGLCLATCSADGLTPVGLVFHQFGNALEPAGATGAVVLAESHLAVHTWPETRSVSLDLYVCNFSHDNSSAARDACRRLISAFAPARVLRRELVRGLPDLAGPIDPTGESD